MTPDKYQQAVIDEYRSSGKNIFISATAGCLGKNVEVLMFDGSTKLSQDICVGDKVMGPDSNPRNVLKVDRGISDLYEVAPVKGEKWVCNDEHIFTVHDQYITRSMRIYNSSHTTDVVDKHIKDILKFQRADDSIGHLKLVRTGVEFEEKPLPIDPYLLGIWLAEGNKGEGHPRFTIYKQDTEIVNYLSSYPFPEGIECKINNDGDSCFGIRFVGVPGKKNPFREEFKKCLDGYGNVFIPQEYLINSRKNRLRLLAGLLDGDGYKDDNGCCFSISTKWETLGRGIVYLVRSLGLFAHYKWKRSTIKSRNFEGYYFRIGISGHTEVIPNILLRKKATQRRQVKDVLHTGFSLKKLGKGEWFGFTVDGDNRYLLGDFTITHNSGKTTVLLEMAKRTPPTKPMIFLAFNKSIAEELSRKLPVTVKAQTLHSCALAALRKAYNFKFKISENKYFDIAKNDLDWKGVHPKRIPGIIVRVLRVFDLMRVNLVGGNPEKVMELAMRYGEDCNEDVANRAISLHTIAKMNADRFFAAGADGTLPIDFTDMLVYAVQYIDKEDFKQYSVVMVDETQDLSPLQYALVKRLKTPKGRLIAVGDQRQTIYSFQGANLDSLNAIRTAPNTVTLPLSMSYRCARKIVEEANKVFPGDIEAAPFAQEGSVSVGGKILDAQDGDFILCRNNAPLVKAFLRLLKAGKPCSIIGKEFGDELVALMDEVEQVEDLDRVLENMISRLRAKGVKFPEKTESYGNLDEKVNIILDLYDYFGSLAAVKSKIYDIFVENSDNKGVILSTIHKSKGLEADRVFFLEPQLIPSKFATTELALYAEKCLQFVAITRAKKELVYVY